jgi:hypothetical protein
MKTLLLLGLGLLAALYGIGAHAAKPPCNQKVYDSVYGQILQHALDDHSKTDVVMKVRNTTIINLRKLCRGQKSTLETTLPYPYKHEVWAGQ